ncbi:DNA polymerase III subunit gamma and tau [Arthrobacter sp. zg-Y750]|uniref:DNA polymerase III subunit gamma and tau n=1 Tax=Arthrobacter sp. zg-Y750 TaxID=2894189 RepID=UPI002F42504D|nr:DNA polymerase III subunit gamma and tau [Arthrobacter sp. zg-Y750]
MSTALYRRYRPESFADVIGQEHVTEPLMAALQKNRVNHAYLFSGPRGCGKTTSARILARCLNCAEGPTPVPCGKCDSCIELARDGSGSLDVIEIDAASHGGVDDARDLRERATFAPVRDRYKIFIIDEAHMVTSAGFNALLKIVEEPPEHIKFIFATTEPDKVIGTIRSRTHHYPFRLVPPEPLLAYLEKLCAQEQVAVAPGVLSLVIRAGGGSVRDTLSVLDQLMAGAGPEGLDYELAVSLLGYTPVSLLDDVVDAVAAADAATVFRAVDRVIQTGQDPRRFVEDLLERFRDLIIVNAMPDSAAAVLRGMPEDQISRMQTQAAQLGGSELSRAADITNTALTEMTGATSPRLHLELLCARILLPAADQTERGTAARVDRLERRLSYAGDPTEAMGRAAAAASPVTTIPAAAPTASQSGASAPSVDEAPSSPRGIDFAATPSPGETSDQGGSDAPAADSAPAAGGSSLDWGGTWSTPVDAPGQSSPAASSTAGAASAPAQSPAADRSGSAPSSAAAPAGPAGSNGSSTNGSQAPAQQPTAPQPAQQPAAGSPAAPSRQAPAAGHGAAPTGGGGQIEMIRRAWPEIMDALTSIRRATWLNVSKNSSPRSFDGKVLELAFSNPGAATNFNRPDHLDNLRKAIHQVLALDCQINPIHDSSASAGESGPKADSRRAPASAPAATVPAGGPGSSAANAPAGQAPSAPSAGRPDAPATAEHPDEPVAPGTPASAIAGTVASAPTVGPAGAARTAEARPDADTAAAGNARTTSPGSGTQDAGGSGAPAWPLAAAAVSSSAATVAPSVASSPAAPTHAAGRNPEAADTKASEPAAAAPVNAASAALRRRTASPSNAPGASASRGTGAGRGGGRAAQSGPRQPAPSDEPWPDEPSDPFNDAPESNAWETAEAPADVYSGGHLSDSEWATTNWAGTGSSAAPATGANGQTGAASAPAAAKPAAEAAAPAARASAPAAPAARASAPAAPAARASAPAAPATPAAPAGPNQPLSRYQKLLNEAAQRGGGAPVRGSRPVDSAYVEDVPSADDITLEDSGLVGRKAIERILGGRLIEERSVDGR